MPVVVADIVVEVLKQRDKKGLVIIVDVIAST